MALSLLLTVQLWISENSRGLSRMSWFLQSAGAGLREWVEQIGSISGAWGQAPAPPSKVSWGAFPLTLKYFLVSSVACFKLTVFAVM